MFGTGGVLRGVLGFFANVDELAGFACGDEALVFVDIDLFDALFGFADDGEETGVVA